MNIIPTDRRCQMTVRRQKPTKEFTKKTNWTKKTVVTEEANATKKPRLSVKEGAFEYTIEKLSHYIAERAYYLWEEFGRPEGQDLEIWRRAEKEILSKLIKR